MQTVFLFYFLEINKRNTSTQSISRTYRFVSYRIVSYRIVLYCSILYCIVLHCVVLYYITLYCIVSYHIVLCCIVLHCIVLYCIVLHYIVLYYIVLYYIVLYCITLYCIVLYYIVLYCIVLSRVYVTASILEKAMLILSISQVVNRTVLTNYTDSRIIPYKYILIAESFHINIYYPVQCVCYTSIRIQLFCTSLQTSK